ncbi:MAG: hypothetical protein M1830_006116 [Pleopsidium flavum]|nr:MAG: hypothetical protein M1830_006116 [Pleopsidium flavum]
MANKLFEKYDREHITDDILQKASQLFSKNYGVWGKEAAKVIGPFAKEGSPVKMSKDRLRTQCLPSSADCSYVRVLVDGHLAGNAFACRWIYKDKVVCWITQLVVDRDYRERGLALGLLQMLKQDDDGIYGLVSSHAAACLAATKVFGNGIAAVNLDFIREHGEAIMKASPVSYIKDAKPTGNLFNPKAADGTVSCLNTSFFVDHTEPLEALEGIREQMDWPLGELIDGHEFLVIVEARRRARSKFRSKSLSPAA